MYFYIVYFYGALHQYTFFLYGSISIQRWIDRNVYYAFLGKFCGRYFFTPIARVQSHLSLNSCWVPRLCCNLKTWKNCYFLFVFLASETVYSYILTLPTCFPYQICHGEDSSVSVPAAGGPLLHAGQRHHSQTRGQEGHEGPSAQTAPDPLQRYESHPPWPPAILNWEGLNSQSRDLCGRIFVHVLSTFIKVYHYFCFL